MNVNRIGRPRGRKKSKYSTRLETWIIAWLRDQDNQAKTIERAIVDYYRLKSNQRGTKNEFATDHSRKRG